MTATMTNRYVVVPWREMPRWDLKTARASAFRALHPHFRPLGEFVEEATELVRPMDHPDKLWPVYGVNNTTGVFLSQEQKGSDFNAAYKRIERDWFFHNPTRANVGSLGRVGDVPADAVTSPEYQVWRIVRGLLPEYVEILIRTRFFLELVQWHRVGAVKERLFVQNLCEIPVPVLSEKQQRAVVETFSNANRSVAAVEKQIEEVRRKTDAAFLADLGLTPGRQSRHRSC